MSKKWKLSIHVLRKWAKGRGLYVVPPEGLKHKVRLEIIGLHQYLIDEKRVEFINYSPEGDEEINTMPRACFEELAFTGHSHDKELNVDYYTEEGLPRGKRKLNT